MKNILLPTDLTVSSLRPVHEIIRDAKGQKPVIHIVHLLSVPTSLLDLLFIKQNKPYNSVPANFAEAFQLLRNKYQGQVEKMVFDFVYCGSSQYFNNFVEGNKIDGIYLLGDYSYRKPLAQSEEVMPYLNCCKVPLRRSSLQPEEVAEYQNLSALLTGKKPVATSTPVSTEEPVVSYS